MGSVRLNDEKRFRQRVRRNHGRRGTTPFVYIVGAALLLVLAGVVAVRTAAAGLYAVKVEDTVLGYTADKTLPDSIVARLAEEEAARVGAEVVLETPIAIEKVKSKDIQATEADALAEAIRAAVAFKAKGWVISVNGQDIVALSTEDEARGAISDLRASYIQTLVNGRNATVDEVLINEQIDIEEKEFDSDLFRTKEEAVKILARGTDKTLNYTVQRGDSLWSIAQANHLSVSELRKANPEVTGDLIKEGQTLNLVVPNPYVTLKSREKVTFTQSIPFTVQVSYDSSMWPWQEQVVQAGRSGTKEIVQEIVRENGKEVSRVTLSEKILAYPVTKKIIRGSKQVPAMGSGQMAWPVQGTITSYFGWRWGSFHQGIDIGAPSGTPVVAADAGMVSFAGRNGGYGNLVKINHGNGKETYYAHLSKFAVKTGDKVEKGQVIGYVGSTGNSTGPHLHFEVREGGTAKNPLSYYK